MHKVYIVDQAFTSGLGNNTEESWEKLCAGQSAIAEIKHFDTGRIDFHNASVVPDLRRQEQDNLVCALARRSLDQLKSIPQDAFIIWTGIKGDVEMIESGMRKNDIYLPVHYRRFVSELKNINNRGTEINAACASSTVGLALGAHLIKSGQESSVLVCAADLVSRFTHMGFSALKALSPTVCRPFDQNRDGLALGEGSSSILLCSEKKAHELGYKPLSEISGWGIANDANHITGPARDGYGLILAVESALKMSGITADDVEAFSAHGTGTPYNDGMELTAIETIFGKRRFPVFSVKGAIGHTLGAAGGIEAAISTLALHRKIIPPTSGLVEPEERAQGRLSAATQSFEGNNILTTNSGFGGVNAALMLNAV